jgi:glycosyltransferase involved in cell wall biosynthesis
MKISILLEAFQPEYWGGRETRWLKIIEELSKNHEVTIFGDFSRSRPEIAFPNMQLRAVNIGPLPDMYNLAGSRSIKHAFMYTFQARKVVGIEADILLTDQTPLISMPLVRIYALLNRSKFSVVWHELWDLSTWRNYSKKLALLGIAVQSIAIMFSDNIVVPSERVYSEFKSHFKRKKVTVIKNGFDLMLMSSELSVIRTRDQASVKLLYVGRLISHKNCDFLLQLMSTASRVGKSWKLTIVGSGPMLEELHRMSKTENLDQEVEFFQNIDVLTLNRLYNESDVFVFPSEREGYGISVAEALTHNLPVVVYDVTSNASADLVTEEVLGTKVSCLDPDAWIDAIEKLSILKSDEISAKFHESQSTWSEISKKYECFLSDVIKAN